MTARAAALLASVGLAVAACTTTYEIPLETPIQPKIDTSAFQSVLVAGFISGGSDDVDANLETVRLLRSQLRTKSSMKVIEADVLPLAEVADRSSRRADAGNDGGRRPAPDSRRSTPNTPDQGREGPRGVRRRCSPTRRTGRSSARSSRAR